MTSIAERKLNTSQTLVLASIGSSMNVKSLQKTSVELMVQKNKKREKNELDIELCPSKD